MKNILIALLLAIAIALGALAYHQASQAAQNRAELLSVHEELAAVQNKLKAGADVADKIASEARSRKALQETLVKTSQFADEKAKQAEQLQQKLADTKTNSSNPLAGMAKMFNDPKMREMIKSQQKMVMGPMIDKQYGALFEQLKLTPDESGQLKKLLTDKMLAGADAGMAMMDGSLDEKERAEQTKKMKAEQEDYDAQIKQFFGDGYDSYKNYEKTVPDRMVVSQFGDALSGDAALQPDQQAQLIQALNEERTGFKWTTDFSDQSKPPADGNYAAMFTEEKLDKFTQEKEKFDQQFLARAQKILSPEQFKQYAQFQKTQRDMQIMGMKMAAQMFGGENH